MMSIMTLPEHHLPRIGLRIEKHDYVMGMLDVRGDLLKGKPKALFESDPREDIHKVNRKAKNGRKPRIPYRKGD